MNIVNGRREFNRWRNISSFYRRRRFYSNSHHHHHSHHSDSNTIPTSTVIATKSPSLHSGIVSNLIAGRGKFSSPKPTISDSIYNSNLRLTCLGRHGRVRDARKLFDQMPQRDVVSYASMITVYIKANELSRAEELFRAMPERNVVADSAMIDAYAKAGRMVEARRIFECMPHRNAFSWTSLISGYFKNGNVSEGRQLFDRMPCKNVVSWTTVVLGYAGNGLINQARTIFDRIPGKNVVAWTAMIKSYIDGGRIDEAMKLFNEMPQRNLYSWNVMIQGCLNDSRVAEALCLFDLMPQRNAVSWTTMVTGLARNGSAKLARQYFDMMPTRDIAAWNAMITVYVDEGFMTEASVLFSSMHEKNAVTWNAVIDGYAKWGPKDEALKHLILMLRGQNIRPNESTLTSVLTSCDGMEELSQAHALAFRLGLEHELSLANSLLTMYSRNGDLGASELVFASIETKDIVSWTAMILAYSNHGYGSHAVQTFARMLRSGIKPDEITFVGVLSACSHAGLVKKGQRFFNAMVQVYGMKPKAEHYSCLVDILGRAGQVDEALAVVNEMPVDKRDDAVLGALLGACKLHGDVALADKIGHELISLKPSQSGGYVLLSNVYAASARWKEFAQVRKQMKNTVTSKVPGFSQIQVKGSSHVFFVGDRSHPFFKDINQMIRENLLPQMRRCSLLDDFT